MGIMRSQHHPHYLDTAWILIFSCVLLLVFSATSVTSMRCSVCSSPGSAGLSTLLQQFPSLEGTVPGCDEDGQQPLEMQCPQKIQAGCLTQTTLAEGYVSKLCSMIPVDDCKSANGIEYCYCRGDMCNRDKRPPVVPIPLPTSPHKPPPTPPSQPHSFQVQVDGGDDEDDSYEGSGRPTPGVQQTPASPKVADTPKSSPSTPGSSVADNTKRPPNSGANSSHISNTITLLLPLLLLVLIPAQF